MPKKTSSYKKRSQKLAREQARRREREARRGATEDSSGVAETAPHVLTEEEREEARKRLHEKLASRRPTKQKGGIDKAALQAAMQNPESMDPAAIAPALMESLPRHLRSRLTPDKITDVLRAARSGDTDAAFSALGVRSGDRPAGSTRVVRDAITGAATARDEFALGDDEDATPGLTAAGSASASASASSAVSAAAAAADSFFLGAEEESDEDEEAGITITSEDEAKNLHDTEDSAGLCD
jgi:hypothetical protein